MRFGAIIFAILTCAECYIIPEELPSLLSIVYSSIPPVKKGTDSRVGLGFRLGPYVDFQILLELGPQTNTDSLGSPMPEYTAKRETLVMENPQNLLEYIEKFKNTFSPAKKKKVESELSDSPGGKWMDRWRNNILGTDENGKILFEKVPGIDDRNSKEFANDGTTFNGVQSSIADYLGQLYRHRTKPHLQRIKEKEAKNKSSVETPPENSSI